MADKPQKPFDAALEAAAKAMFEFQVSSARKKFDEIGVGLTDALDFFVELMKESDAGLVVLGTSYIDSQLTDGWAKNMSAISKANAELLLDHAGPLATMSARIRLAHALGWLTEKTASDLHIVRKIRNVFAHDPYRRHLSDPTITGLISSMNNVEDRMLEAAKSASSEPKFRTLTPRMRFHMRLPMLSYAVVCEMVAGPIAMAHQIPVGALMGNYDAGPVEAKRALHAVVEAALNVAKDTQ